MLQVGNIVMVDRHVVRKALRGTSAVWKNFLKFNVGNTSLSLSQTMAHCIQSTPHES